MEERHELSKQLIEEEVEQDAPSLLEKLEQAKFEYSPEGTNPSPEMYDHITKIVDRIRVVRKAQARADEMKKRKRKAQKQARKKNRGRR